MAEMAADGGSGWFFRNALGAGESLHWLVGVLSLLGGVRVDEG